MYEKTVLWILAICLLFLMTACGANPSSSYGASDTPSSEEQEESFSSSDISEMSAPEDRRLLDLRHGRRLPCFGVCEGYNIRSFRPYLR